MSKFDFKARHPLWCILSKSPELKIKLPPAGYHFVRPQRAGKPPTMADVYVAMSMAIKAKKRGVK